MFLRFSWSWISRLGLHDNGYMALINNNEFWMTVEHWERFGVLRVLRVTRWLMAVVNFMINCAVIISVAQSISASAWSKNTFRTVKVLSAALIPLTLVTLEDAERPPRGHSTETSADGDGDHVADVLHHELSYIGQMSPKNITPVTHVTESLRKSTEDFNWVFAWFPDFTRIIKAVSVDQWQGWPSWHQNFAPFAGF